MNNKKKLAAGGAALLVGAVGYGVYATTLAVADETVSFAAGAGTANQVENFGAVTIDAGTPTFDGKSVYSFNALTITPVKENWKAVDGKTIRVVAYNAKGEPIGEGSQLVDAKLGTGAEEVLLKTKPNANDVVTWGIVIQ
ncbi:MAG: hypothetical protein WC054_02115 [Candidatus Nanopelagicales bacterium]